MESILKAVFILFSRYENRSQKTFGYYGLFSLFCFMFVEKLELSRNFIVIFVCLGVIFYDLPIGIQQTTLVGVFLFLNVSYLSLLPSSTSNFY